MGLEPTTFGTTIRHSNRLSYIHRFRPQSRNFANRCANVIRFLVCARISPENYSNRRRAFREKSAGFRRVQEPAEPTESISAGTIREAGFFRQNIPTMFLSTVRRRRTLPAGKPRPMRRTDARRHSPVARPFGGQHTHVRRIYRMDQGNFRGDASRKTMQASFPSLLVFRLYDCTPDVVLRQNRTGRLFLCPAFPTSAAPKPAARQCSNKFDIAPAYSYL